MLNLELLFAGASGFIFHWGTGVGLIVLLVAAAYFSSAIPLIGPFLHEFRKDLFWAAAAIGLFLAGQYVGAQDEVKRCVAKTVVIERTVDRIVRETTPTPEPVVIDKKTHKPIKRRAPRDRWDNPGN